ncbi:non-heme iron oxygenase ferredoxin subunit [Thalassoroseus pseudoceratinae]|uniref:non-heme iron oxygenase ferredoxin subunit n=1 Tax=Thalassoroseus pseudoceratinae TaxID=2713176 RepID=UPI0014211F90|nr:non-heme iron oxygenase ferredoxin subunit [Thalassoroseus pseudoceratinae]
MTIEWNQVATPDEIAPGNRKSLVVDDLPALLIRVGDDYFCIEDTCTHDGGEMTDGPVQDKEIVCPRHGARFSLETGAALCMPATEPIRTFEVDIRDDGIYVGF